MYEFIYCFVMNGKINWSTETINSLSRWLNEEDNNIVSEFINKSNSGDFITLNSGALIFRCKPTPIEINLHRPRKLIDVLTDANLIDDDYSFDIFEK